MRKLNPFVKKSSLLGRQQRADARRNAHERSLSLDKTLNPAGYKMPAPGPMTEGKKKNRWVDLKAAKASGCAKSFGLGHLAYLDFVKKVENGSEVKSKPTNSNKKPRRKIQK